MPSASTAAGSDAPPTEEWSGVAVSLAFWLMLAAAAGLFAIVSLAPKLSAYLTLRDQQRAQQVELAALEQRHAELGRVIAALKDDPLFAAEMARMEFDAVRPGEEILAVESSLALEPSTLHQPVRPGVVQRSAWHPWISVLAYYQPLRNLLLTAAAILVLIAFGWMQERTQLAE